MTLAAHLVLLAALFFATSAQASPEKRPLLATLETSDSIVIREGYSSHKLVVANAALRKRLLAEAAALDGKAWKEVTIIKHGGCAIHVAFFEGPRWLADLIIYKTNVYQAPLGSTKNPQFVSSLAQGELSSFREAFARLAKSKSCENAA